MAKDLLLAASQAASKADAAFHQGEDLTLTATMAPAANITGWTLTFSIKKQYGDAAALLTKTVGAGITIIDAANGVFQIALASADTAALETRQYVFDIQRTNSGSRTVLTIGNITVLPQVSL